jgi:acetylornithine/N-succinyldiaminopimelate aminotransferase
MPSYSRNELVLAQGKGATVKDLDGKEYIDFGSGIGVNSLGFCDEKWLAAVTAQAGLLQHCSNLYYSVPQSLLAQKLSELTGYEKAFFANSGAEANECAIKLARKYSFDKYGGTRNKIITLKNSFHGRTVTTITATGQEAFHNYFFPFTPGFVYADPEDISDLKAKLDEDVCAVMFEFIQGEGGVVPLDVDYVEELFALCGERDILTIADEVQSGIGRTGTVLASELFGVKPDITTVAKGLGGGLPIGACLAGEELAQVLSSGMHGSTFGGNPVACAGALAVLDRLGNEAFLYEVTHKGDILAEALEDLDGIAAVTGAGLMLGAELETAQAKDIAAAALKEGLIVLTAKDKLRFLPPLVITEEELKKGIAILTKVLKGE